MSVYSTTFQLRIVAPDRVLFEGGVLGVRLPGAVAPFEILPRHAPIVSALEPGELRIASGDPGNPQYRYLALSDGVVESTRSGTDILVNAAENPEEIDVERAEASKERARRRLLASAKEINAVRAEASLSRAAARLRTAKRTESGSE